MSKNSKLLPGLGGPDINLFGHMDAAPGTPRKIDFDRLFTDMDYRRVMGGHIPPQKQGTDEAVVVEAVLKENAAGYPFTVEIRSSERDLQSIYDWAFARLGLDAYAWSISGNNVIGFRNRADAEALVETWHGYGALSA